MSKSFGTMMSGKDSLELLDKIRDKINFKKQEKEFGEMFDRMRNRFAYHIDQAEPLKPVLHKGKKSLYGYWTCRNCGCGITYDVNQNYCWKCGHQIAWDSPRCLTGVHDSEN